MILNILKDTELENINAVWASVSALEITHAHSFQFSVVKASIYITYLHHAPCIIGYGLSSKFKLLVNYLH